MTLSYLRDHDGCPQQELAEAFCMDANNVVLLLNELEELGYVARLRDPARSQAPPRRAHPAGRSALARAERAQEAIEDEVLARARRRGARDALATAHPRALRSRAARRSRTTGRRSRRSRRRRPAAAPPRRPRRARAARRRRTTAYTSLTAAKSREVGHVHGQAHRALERSVRRRRTPRAGSPGSGAPARRRVAPTSSPVAGSSGIWPEQNSERSTASSTAWL